MDWISLWILSKFHEGFRAELNKSPDCKEQSIVCVKVFDTNRLPHPWVLFFDLHLVFLTSLSPVACFFICINSFMSTFIKMRENGTEINPFYELVSTDFTKRIWEIKTPESNLLNIALDCQMIRSIERTSNDSMSSLGTCPHTGTRVMLFIFSFVPGFLLMMFGNEAAYKIMVVVLFPFSTRGRIRWGN